MGSESYFSWLKSSLKLLSVTSDPLATVDAVIEISPMDERLFAGTLLYLEK